MLKTYTFKRTKNSRLKLCTNLLGKKFIKIRFLRSSDCLPPAFPLKETRWCTVCTLRSKASLKILLAYFELMTFRARSEEQILKITDRFTIFPGQQMFHLRFSSHLLVLSRQQAWKQIRFSNNTFETIVHINNYSKLKQSAYYSLSSPRYLPKFSTLRFPTFISTMSTKERVLNQIIHHLHGDFLLPLLYQDAFYRDKIGF